MINNEVEFLLKKFFHSDDRRDWVDKEAWQKRALFWKYMAMAFKYAPREKVIPFFDDCLKRDMHSSPTESIIMQLANFVAHYYIAEKEKVNVS